MNSSSLKFLSYIWMEKGFFPDLALLQSSYFLFLEDKAERDDLIEETKSEIQVLEEYLPQQLSEEELEQIVIETIAQVGATSMKDMGKIMSTIKPKTAGRADGRKINELVKKNL